MGVDVAISIEELINKILAAVKIEDLIDINNFKPEFKYLIQQVHPDKCSLPKAALAAAKLNQLRDRYEKGTSLKDEVAEFLTNGYRIEWKVVTDNQAILSESIKNYEQIKHDAQVKAPHLLKYLPKNITIEHGNCVVTLGDERAIPLSGLNLPQEHVNWILSRLLEFSLMLNQTGYTHCGLTPESVFIVPETHGIIVMSFYHVAKVDKKVNTINGNYKNWYPADLFTTKKATPEVDLRLSKKIAVYLLGDNSGSGVRLKKDHNEVWVNFCLQIDKDPVQCYDNYRRILKENFEKKFYPLNL